MGCWAGWFSSISLFSSIYLYSQVNSHWPSCSFVLLFWFSISSRLIKDSVFVVLLLNLYRNLFHSSFFLISGDRLFASTCIASTGKCTVLLSYTISVYAVVCYDRQEFILNLFFPFFMVHIVFVFFFVLLYLFPIPFLLALFYSKK